MRCVGFFLIFFCSLSFSNSPETFAQAKKIAGKIFQEHPKTIYCHCNFVDKEVDLASCTMESAQDKKRAHHIEFEHLQAAEHFGQQFECWRKPLCQDKKGHSFKGRRCCQKIDALYRHAESELYNLWPEVGLVNQARSNYRFGIVSLPKNYYGCSLAIDKAMKKVEPKNSAKGTVARAYLFMTDHYHLSLSDSQRQLFNAWNKQFAPSTWEQQWAQKIALIEGYDNPYITHWHPNTF